MADDPTRAWHPVARADDLPFRHIYETVLLGRELALWRADDGFVNVWENRCLHRGVRLSIGLNEGRELRCRYHGWRYANRSAGCTYIPAHPADAPARTICCVTFPVRERHGLIWTGEAPDGEPPTVAALGAAAGFGLRNLPIDAEPDVVLANLAGYRFAPSALVTSALAPSALVTSGGAADETATGVVDCGPGWVALSARAGDHTDTVIFFVQPVDSSRSVVRGVLAAAPVGTDALAVLRHHNRQLVRLRDRIEAGAATRPRPDPITVSPARVAPDLAAMPVPSAGGSGQTLRVRVAGKRTSGEGIAAFELEPLDGQLPTFQPGAHIDVHLPNSLVRQYSLVNGPGELARYVIGVKLEPESRGGSACLHDTVREGDVLAVSEPRNNFSLRRDSYQTVLIAGGIGITPLLAMAQALHVSSLDYRLHYFAQTETHVAFPEIIGWLGGAVTTHLGLSSAATGDTLARILAEPVDGHSIYICGPGPMLDAARRIAAEAGWADDAVHFEYFKNANAIDTATGFEVELARSALTLVVPPGQSIMHVLRANGVTVPSSCEQGACGTCIVTVLAGEPDHQDVYLNNTERKAGNQIAVCVSRAISDRLVLDI